MGTDWLVTFTSCTWLAVALCQGNSRTKSLTFCPILAQDLRRLDPGHGLCRPGLAWWCQEALGPLFPSGSPPLPWCWLGGAGESRVGVQSLATEFLTLPVISRVTGATRSAF